MKSPMNLDNRRAFLCGLTAVAGISAAVPTVTAQAQQTGDEHRFLPYYARALDYRSLKQSSYDREGGNRDFISIEPGATEELFNSPGPGVITHIWFTISADPPWRAHLKELVLRMYWDGNEKPCVEAPVGDFFGLNLGQYVLFESAYLACSPAKSLNCYFAMPFRKSARVTVTNEATASVRALYYNIDYQVVRSLPADTLYFHAQYRQCTPCSLSTGNAAHLNTDGKLNYVFLETRGRGHLMGVTLGVLLNADGWFGEGDDMIFVDDESKPLIIGTGSEDYFLGSFLYGGRESYQSPAGRDGAVPFSHYYYGAPLIVMPERTGGRYCCYRFHGDNPIAFGRYLRHTMEHGHANDRGDNFYSVCYWYQDTPYTDFPALPPVADRIPRLKLLA